MGPPGRGVHLSLTQLQVAVRQRSYHTTRQHHTSPPCTAHTGFVPGCKYLSDLGNWWPIQLYIFWQFIKLYFFLTIYQKKDIVKRRTLSKGICRPVIQLYRVYIRHIPDSSNRMVHQDNSVFILPLVPSDSLNILVNQVH